MGGTKRRDKVNTKKRMKIIIKILLISMKKKMLGEKKW